MYSPDSSPCESSSRYKSGKVKRKWVYNQENDVFWYPAQATSPPSNYTPGIIPLLKKHLWTCHAQGITLRAALCYKGSVHISRELWDASWGCGYRNFLMACTALMDQSLQASYFPLLDAPLRPGVRNLQMWIETAWQAGFDREGAKELKTLVGTNKWIGTSDIWVAFSYRGIPVELVDFNLKNQSRGVQILTDWVIEYFSPKIKGATINDALRNASPIAITDRMPLILQDHHHSRTIVGYELLRDGTVNLLTFDPGFTPARSLRNLALSLALCSPHNISSMATDQCIHADRNSNVLQHNSYIPSSTDGGSDAKRRRFWHWDGQNHSNERPLQKGQANCEGISGGTVSGLSHRQQFAHFRLSPKRLSKQKYQILYFPMSAPLTDQERIRNKVVTSTKIC